MAALTPLTRTTLLIGGVVLLALAGARNGVSKAALDSPFPAPQLAFAVPLPILPKLTPTSVDANNDYYDITMRVAQKKIIPGKLTTIWGYNGMYPGPTIVARRGRTIVVRQHNNLPESVSVHLHGGHTPPESDGFPTDLIGPGATKVYTYPNMQDAATLWYHDHAIDTTGRHVYMGLAGVYLVSDPQPTSLPQDDVALMIQDRLFDSNGAFVYPVTESTIRFGILGDTLLVNGAIQPYYQVARRKVRFRIVNGSNTRTYNLALSNGAPLVQIATDGGLLPAPVSRSSIVVSAAERIEVVIDFASYPIGTSIVLKNLDTTSPALPDLMRFDVTRDAYDTSSVPAKLRPLARIPETAATVTRNFTLERSTQNGLTIWTINGLLYDPARVDAAPQLNATEIWRFQNNSSETHPMHIHDIQWQILDINGVPPSPGDAGMKDTFLVPNGGGIVRVIGTFTDNVGYYVSHCHKVEHEDHAMMFNFAVQP